MTIESFNPAQLELVLLCADDLPLNWQCLRDALSLIDRNILVLIFGNYFSNPACPASYLTGHAFIRIENFDFKEISFYSASMIDYLQTESGCLFCNSLLLKIDLIDRFSIWIRNASLFTCLLNGHSLLVDEADELFSLVVGYLNVVVFFCHLLLGKFKAVLNRKKLSR